MKLAKIEVSQALENLTKFLNEPVPSAMLKINQGVNYVSIGYIENKLDEIYLHTWKTSNIKAYQLLNSICVEITLSVLDPVSGQWIERAGVGAVPIQTKKGEILISPESLNTFAIQKGLPAAKAYALKNAAQSLGVIFGRNINRVEDFEFTPLSEQVENFSQKLEVFDTIDKIDTMEDLRALWDSLAPELRANNKVIGAINKRKKQLK
jgi:hypothetical protein